MREIINLEGNDDYVLNARNLPGDNIAIMLHGDIKSGSISVLARVATLEANVYDAGPITSETIDNVGGLSARRIVIPGRADEIVLRVKNGPIDMKAVLS